MNSSASVFAWWCGDVSFLRVSLDNVRDSMNSCVPFFACAEFSCGDISFLHVSFGYCNGFNELSCLFIAWADLLVWSFLRVSLAIVMQH